MRPGNKSGRGAAGLQLRGKVVHALSDREAVNGGQRAGDVCRFFRRLDDNLLEAGAGADLDAQPGVLQFKKISIRL
jgi:hypothetical protein